MQSGLSVNKTELHAFRSHFPSHQQMLLPYFYWGRRHNRRLSTVSTHTRLTFFPIGERCHGASGRRESAIPHLPTKYYLSFLSIGECCYGILPREDSTIAGLAIKFCLTFLLTGIRSWLSDGVRREQLQVLIKRRDLPSHTRTFLEFEQVVEGAASLGTSWRF